jgi:Leucine-rich repeat (LRR) protein
MASRLASLLFTIPDDVWHLVVEFATHSMRQVLRLQQIDSHFRTIMRNPLMVTHLEVEVNDLSHVRRMKSLGFGVHYLKAQALPASAALDLLACTPNVRGLNLSHGNFDSTAFQQAIVLLPQLQQLNVSFCRQLVRIQALPDTLRELDVMYCTRLVELPPMANLQNLDASHCSRLSVLPALPALVSANLGYGLTAINAMDTLRHLKIGQASVPDSRTLTRLDSLCLVDCNFEQEWFCAPLTNLTALTLVFVSYRRAHDLSALSMLTGLQKLHLETGVCDDNLASLESLVRVKSLFVASELISDDGLGSIAKMRALETLYINNCRRKQITDQGLCVLAALPQLRSLHLSECYGVAHRMQGLSALTQLQALCIDNDHDAREASRWPVTPEEALIDQWAHEDDFEPLTALPNLTTLELLYCSVMSLRWLNQIPRLDMLVVKGCDLTLTGLWDLVPCNIASVVLGERARATLGDDVEMFRQRMSPHALVFESEEGVF